MWRILLMAAALCAASEIHLIPCSSAPAESIPFSRELCWIRDSDYQRLGKSAAPLHQDPPQWRYKKAADPLLHLQWHLPTPIARLDGRGVNITIVDDGVDFGHPDLEDAYLGGYDYNQMDSDPSPGYADDGHGTSAIGVALAKSNTHCGIGVAPGASFWGVRLISGPITDLKEALALTWNLDQTDIYTNSWGPDDSGHALAEPGALTRAALRYGTHEGGRMGKGSVYLWAAGNGRTSKDNSNYDGWANSPYTMAICALNYRGTVAWYSEPGANLFLCAPSSGTAGKSITTTDVRGPWGYTSGECNGSFGGTSSATPFVAGLIANVFHIRPDLSWRSIQDVMIAAADRVDPTHTSWRQNGAGHWISHDYGFGAIRNFTRLMDLASRWPTPSTSDADWRRHDREHGAWQSTLLGPIVAVNQSLPLGQSVHSSVVAIPPGNIHIEYVCVRVSIWHPRRGDLKIELQSPQGTWTLLADVHDDVNAHWDWTFGVSLLRNELARGEWKMRVTDNKYGADTGVWSSWNFTIYGIDV